MSDVDDRRRAKRLRDLRFAATALLVAMAALYVVTSFWLRQAPWLGYVRAFAGAAMVGACADWFAVTALFRRPFGLPIPHTGIIPRNKDRIGEALGAFIADNFLTADILEAKLRQLEVARWGAAWLRRRRNADLVAERLVKLIPELLALSTPEARRRFVGALASDILASAQAAPFAAGVLRAVWGGERSDAILDAAIDLLAGSLARNDDLVKAEVAERTYRWVPRWVNDMIGERVLGALARTLDDMRQPEHPWRERVRQAVDDFIDRLETDPALAAKAEEIKHRIASNPAVLDRLAEFSDALEARLNPATEAEQRRLRARLGRWIAGLGRWLYREQEAIEIFNDWARLAVQRTVAPRRRQIGRAIASVVAGWDVRSVVDKLELQVGADLQYIRVNGALVGGLVGLVIFTLSTWFALPS